MEIQKLKEMVLSNDIDLMTLACTIIVQKDLIDTIFIGLKGVQPTREEQAYYSFISGTIGIAKQEVNKHFLIYKNNKGILCYYNLLYIVKDVEGLWRRYNELKSIPKERIIKYGKDYTNDGVS